MSISNVFEVAALPPQPHSRSIFRRMPTPTNMQQSVSSLSRARSYDNLDFDIVPVELPPAASRVRRTDPGEISSGLAFRLFVHHVVHDNVT